MQGDPIIQAPDDLQNYNRYIYCFNNPLGCTDPSGFSGWTSFRGIFLTAVTFLISPVASVWVAQQQGLISARTARQITGAALAFVLGPGGGVLQTFGLSALEATAVAGFVGGAVSTSSFKGGIQGAFSALLFYGVGREVGNFTNSAGDITNYGRFATSVALHGVVGCVTSVVAGGKCGPGALSAAFSKLVSPYTGAQNPVVGTIISAAVGGTASVLGGGKFANGAKTAAYGYIFNCLASKCSGSDYDSRDSNTHFSAPQSSGIICNLSTDGCLQAVRAEISCNSAPGQVGCTPVGQDVPYILNGGNPITQFRPNEDLLINGTDANHIFNDGYVVRWIAIDSLGNVNIWTAGYGTNITGLGRFFDLAARWANQIGGQELFRQKGNENRINIQCKLGLRLSCY